MLGLAIFDIHLYALRSTQGALIPLLLPPVVFLPPTAVANAFAIQTKKLLVFSEQWSVHPNRVQTSASLNVFRITWVIRSQKCPQLQRLHFGGVEKNIPVGFLEKPQVIQVKLELKQGNYYWLIVI